MKFRTIREITAAALASILLLTGCLAGTGTEPESEWSRYRISYMDTFDTIVQNVGYTRTGMEFDRYSEEMHKLLIYYNQLFDRYNSYEGINNVKTINDNAGIAPVQVDEPLLDLLEQCIEWEEQSQGAVNVCMGPVLEIWHNYREQYIGTTEGKLPPMEQLEAAARHTDIGNLVIDREAGTVYLTDPEASLDLGAVAKGYATERIAQQLYADGFTSFAMSSGGNIRVMDAPADGSKSAWVIGIQDPAATMESGKYADSVIANNISVVTSGDYQRYYMVDDVKVHHIVDGKTLMPANRFSSVTIVCEDSGLADMLSTALFILPMEEGRALAEQYGAQAMWIDPEGTVTCTDGLIPMLKERGGATSVPAKAQEQSASEKE